jgi:hypothetical protein
MLAASAAARRMLVDMSLVTVLCSFAATAVEDTYSLTPWIAILMTFSAPTASDEIPVRLPDLAADLVGGLLCLVARFFTSGATTAKPRAGIARARRLDGRVQGQEVDLAGNVADQFHDAAHRSGRTGQRLRLLVGNIHAFDRGRRGSLNPDLLRCALPIHLYSPDRNSPRFSFAHNSR